MRMIDWSSTTCSLHLWEFQRGSLATFLTTFLTDCQNAATLLSHLVSHSFSVTLMETVITLFFLRQSVPNSFCHSPTPLCPLIPLILPPPFALAHCQQASTHWLTVANKSANYCCWLLYVPVCWIKFLNNTGCFRTALGLQGGGGNHLFSKFNIWKCSRVWGKHFH